MVVATGRTTNTGTLGILAILTLPPLPAIVTEWFALIPLICHLADAEEDHQMVGELALTGHLTTGLFPKLGYLNGIWRLLDRGPDFLDRANTRSENAYKVWDAGWGSTFTRANGTACSAITDYALSKCRDVFIAPDSNPERAERTRSTTWSSLPTPPPSPSSTWATTTMTTTTTNEKTRKGSNTSPFRRHQTLHIIRLYRKVQASSLKARIFRTICHVIVQSLYVLSLLATSALLVLLGAYGTAIVILTCLISKAVCLLFIVSRPPGYLESNERLEACMLSASHDNASTWYLYVGDRGVVDWLLNKTMLSLPSRKSRSLNLIIAYFRFAHLMQLLAMTYVAAQKGIDGVSLVGLMWGNYLVKLLGGRHQVARQWLDKEGIGVEAKTFKFTGRTPLVGCVHSMSGAKTGKWMDDLIAPCERREAWLRALQNDELDEREADGDETVNMNPNDLSWLVLNKQLASDAVEMVRKNFPREDRL